MLERLLYKQPKLDTASQIKKALKKELKKQEKLQKKSDQLLNKMKERETKYESYKVNIKECQEQGNLKEASKLQRESLENNRIYGFIKQDYAKVDHQLRFAKNNVARYKKLLKEKENLKQTS